jgi:hypothetical protein
MKEEIAYEKQHREKPGLYCCEGVGEQPSGEEGTRKEKGRKK